MMKTNGEIFSEIMEKKILVEGFANDVIEIPNSFSFGGIWHFQNGK